ncbi:MAG: universal stress protein [Bryobacteraceae bacterium]
MFPISKILLPVDFSERACQAARIAIPVAEHFHSEMIVLHVLPPHFEIGTMDMGSAMLNDLIAERRQHSRDRLESFLTAELGGLPVRRLLCEGDPATEIVDCAHQEQAGLIMMPTHGYGPFRRMLLGSVTAKVLHDVDCPVWTTAHVESSAPLPQQLKRVLCAVDLGPSSARALEWSAKLAAEFGAELLLIHALVELDPRTEGYHFSPEWRRFLVESAEAEIAALQRKSGTNAKVNLAMGPAAECVCEEARTVDAGLLVIGRGTDAGILGRLTGDAYSIIRQSPCPVVSV